MFFPYGEWVIFFLALLTLLERTTYRRLFVFLTMAWILGRGLEGLFPASTTWHWHFARLATMLVFGRWAWVRSERRLLPLILGCFTVSIETLFLVNEPGAFPFEAWLYTIMLIFICWLSARSYWGTAFSFTGSLLFNQVVERFTYEGIVRHADFPEALVWNIGVALMIGWAAWHLGWKNITEKIGRKTGLEILPVQSSGACDPLEEREHQ